MSITKILLHKYTKPPKIESFNRYLFIGPHPDDIEIGAGGTAAKLQSLGKEVAFVVATDGRFGMTSETKGLSFDEIAELRKKEAIKAAGKLGIKKVFFLDLMDGANYLYHELLSRLAKVIGEFKPDMIFAPDPNLPNECHLDHLNVGNAARNLAVFAPFDGIMATLGAETSNIKAIGFYMTNKPNQFVKINKYQNLQIDAILNGHKSQFPEGSKDATAGKVYLKLRSIDMGLRSFKGKAEGFRVLPSIGMHCIPEAGL